MAKPNLSQQTAERLYNLVAVEGRFAPGEKLPSEPALAQSLGVSRATLREALGALTAQGVLEVRRGRGTFVSPSLDRQEPFSFQALTRVKGQLRDLFEVRSIFEPRAARLACQRATREEMAEILRLGERVEQCIRAGEDRTAADRAFHSAIVRATHNEFMARLLPVIDEAVSTAVAAGAHPEVLAGDTLRDHALLLEFFRKGDPEGAEYAMAIHMRHSMDVMELE